MDYSIWFEFEEYKDTNSSIAEDDYCNIEVTYTNGSRRGYNVWTATFFREKLPEILGEVEQEGFSVLPDIIVTRLERKHITDVLKRILPEDPD